MRCTFRLENASHKFFTPIKDCYSNMFVDVTIPSHFAQLFHLRNFEIVATRIGYADVRRMGRLLTIAGECAGETPSADRDPLHVELLRDGLP